MKWRILLTYSNPQKNSRFLLMSLGHNLLIRYLGLFRIVRFLLSYIREKFTNSLECNY